MKVLDVVGNSHGRGWRLHHDAVLTEASGTHPKDISLVRGTCRSVSSCIKTSYSHLDSLFWGLSPIGNTAFDHALSNLKSQDV